MQEALTHLSSVSTDRSSAHNSLLLIQVLAARAVTPRPIMQAADGQGLRLETKRSRVQLPANCYHVITLGKLFTL